MHPTTSNVENSFEIYTQEYPACIGKISYICRIKFLNWIFFIAWVVCTEVGVCANNYDDVKVANTIHHDS